MTLANLFWIAVVGLIVYLMMKKSGGCCGGHGEHHERQEHGGGHDSAAEEHRHDHGQKMMSGAEKDPVCGMDVGDGAVSREFQGKTYRFCSDSCLASFAKDSGKYVDG
jgi:Cu+-exporting ATPase